jgi:hypothetical protein
MPILKQSANHKIGDLLFNPHYGGLGIIGQARLEEENGSTFIKYYVHYCDGMIARTAAWAVKDYKDYLAEKLKKNEQS